MNETLLPDLEQIQTARTLIDLEDRIKQRCPNVDWQRGNETKIPYCRLNGEFCDTRCMWH